jgi:hypothetical protein
MIDERGKRKELATKSPENSAFKYQFINVILPTTNTSN